MTEARTFGVRVARAHPLARMTGRDPDERERVSSPLELLFDLTFVIAVGNAAGYLATSIDESHLLTGLCAFVMAMFATALAWINFTWFASAFDTDDWLYRILTMVQMIGVVVLALGIPRLFESVTREGSFHGTGVVAGYVVMRVALVAQWVRAGRQSATERSKARHYALLIVLAQVCWVVFALLAPPWTVAGPVFVILGLLEVAIPVLVERRSVTPWHPAHIAERYGLFTIITLGEAVVGTVASSSLALHRPGVAGWTWQAVAVVVAGIGLTFAMWWIYFAADVAGQLRRRPAGQFVFGYGHVPLFAAIAATGAGLHVAGSQLAARAGGDGHEAVGKTTALAVVAVPVAVFLVAVWAVRAYLLGSTAGDVALLALSLAVLLVAVALAVAHVDLAACVLVVMLSPFVTVAGIEMPGVRPGRRAFVG
ncbi:low temperature requirement protein A [Allobranchiibius sp. GilTou73]|uniref:low temperature requirement protein A n=1 Tax=Allobranchiibius sp. GilTou73 TaxID=2904523 RepID=UPI001F3555DA|nr:low temperature requirement protein A [Allobranchiibius sp. GilTou73]UIJ35743.1 low temperature requirement protein A [Allobranchiibius sp. GilTou73]